MATKAILFDFWGTLVENGERSPTRKTLSILRIPMEFTEFIVKFEDIFFVKSFESQEDAFKQVCDAFGVRPLPIVISKLVGLWNKNKLFAKPYDSTVPVLTALKEKGIKLAIVTNTNQNAVEEVIEKHGLGDLFDTVVLSYEHGTLKQEGELYEIALKQLEVSKEDALIIGDSIATDMVGAEKLGIKRLLVDRRDMREYENKIKELTEIENHLD
jgi:HAD superfamily hydrolase (TIGR01662 family)